MSATTLFLTDDLYQYVLDKSVRSDPLLLELNELTKQQYQMPMQTSLEQLNFMSLLIKLLNAKSALEIGTFTGMGALTIARAMGSQGKLICLDKNAEFVQHGQPFWQRAGVAEQIELRLGDALDSLAELQTEQQQFDLVYIDADKGNMLNYYEASLAMLQPNGLILADNTLFYARVLDVEDQKNATKGVREFNNFVATDERVDISMLPIGDGLTLIRKR